jgi:hypothetical protein
MTFDVYDLTANDNNYFKVKPSRNQGNSLRIVLKAAFLLTK